MNNEKQPAVKEKRTAKQTLLFLWHSIYRNASILEENERGWVAVLIGILAICLTVVGILTTGLQSNANSIVSTSSETAIDIGFMDLAYDIDNSENKIIINDGKLEGTGRFAPIALTSEEAQTKTYAANATYTYRYDDKDKVVFRLWVLDLDPVNSKEDNTTVTNFRNNSIYQYSSTSSANTWTPSSFMILTHTSIHVYTFKISATATSSATATISGSLATIGDLNFYSLGHDNSGNKLASSDINTKYLDILNKAYDTIKVSYTWSQVGLNIGLNAAIVLIACLIFWLISRTKSSVMHFTFWRSMKITFFMSFSPAVITMIASFFLTSYTPFIFLMCIALRLMSAVQRMGGGNQVQDSKPVYKARS